MKKLFKYTIILSLVLMFAATAYANGSYKISYNYGIADIFSENIINNNPQTVSDGQNVTLSDAVCLGFDFAGWYTDSSHTVPVTDFTGEKDVTLYAKWYESSYEINYVLTHSGTSPSEADITNSNPEKRKSSEEIYLDEPVCISSEFVFEGWYLDSVFTEKISVIESYTNSDITLYAKWSGAKFSVLYDMGQASGSTFPTENPNPDYYTYGEEVVLKPAECKNPDFTFDGWYEDSVFSEKIEKIEKGCSGNVIIYAKWIVKEYPINYVLADSSGISASSVSHSNPLSRTAQSSVLLSDAISADKKYKFDGWYTSPEFTHETKITEIPAKTAEDVTLYAKWSVAVYKISYDYAMISLMYIKIDNTNPEKYYFGDSFTLEPISADGFIFNGWCTDEARKNKVTQLPENTYGDITLYADFTEMTYSISYVLSSDEVPAESVVNMNTVFVRTTTEQISLKEAQTVNSAYKFDGWYLDSDYTNEVEYIRAYTVGNITLYAKWIKNITYVPVWGDATLSDDLTAADARLILRHSAGLEEFTELQKKVSDLNQDGKVNAADARTALRLSASIDKIEDIAAQFNLPEIKEQDGEIVFIEKSE